MIISVVRAELHGCGAFVPSYLSGLMTDRIDEKTGWYPASSRKLSKTEKIKIYEKLKGKSEYKLLSKKQRLFAKHYIRNYYALCSDMEFLLSSIVCEAIAQAKGFINGDT